MKLWDTPLFFIEALCVKILRSTERDLLSPERLYETFAKKNGHRIAEAEHETRTYMGAWPSERR
jgi:hypothetical protein